MKLRTVFVLAVMWAGAIPALAAGEPGVRIDGIDIGFGKYYRPGHMLPVFVKLTNDAPTPFDGELRAVQSDDDGDRLQWRVTADLAAGASQERHVLILPQPGALFNGSIAVSVGAVDGAKYSPQAAANLRGLRGACRPLSAETVIGVLGASLRGFHVLDDHSKRVFLAEPAQAVTIPFARVPTTWRGLDMIDVIYWDDPDVQKLDAAQQAALVQWVRRGGRLVIGLGSRAMEFSTGSRELYSLLPVRPVGTGERVGDWKPLYQYLGSSRTFTEGSAVRVTPRNGADVLVRAGNKMPLLCRWARGAGSVTVLSATLADSGLSTRRRTAAGPLARLLDLHVLNGPRGESLLKNSQMTDGLGGHLDSVAVGGLLIVLVVGLCLLYVLVTGPGTWLYACATKRRHLSWWLFGGMAGLGVAVSVVIASLQIRPESISNAMVLDLTAGSNYAVMRGYFGLYVPAHRTADIEISGDPQASITPMVDPHGSGGGEYPDKKAYDIQLDAEPHLAAPVRRTIKRFALTWQGDIGGTVNGSFKRYIEWDPERSVHFLAGKVTNTLDVDLKNAVVVYAQPGKKQPYARVTLGDIPHGKTLEFSALPGKGKTLHRTRTLTGSQRSIARSIARGGGSFFDRVEFLSTMSLYAQPIGQTVAFLPDSGKQEEYVVSRNGLVRLDRSAFIDPGHALLIAEAEGYTPAGLRVDGDTIPATGSTIVRVLLPVVEDTSLLAPGMSKDPPKAAPTMDTQNDVYY